MYKHEVVKSLDFVIYGCSSWGCIASVLDHFSALISIGIAFVALISLTNYALNIFGTSLEIILGYIFMPLAFLMGAPWSEADILGES